ncbi:hypothetical protein BGZ94_000154 [Podila epigama]|nr:hypothetical protein BGZ94_000154 [Podila epigama]
MYRRRLKKPPVPSFGETLEEIGYSINDKGQLIDAQGQQYAFDLKAKDRLYQEAHGVALAEATMRHMKSRLENECGLVELAVPLGLDPDDTTTPHANVLARTLEGW